MALRRLGQAVDCSHGYLWGPEDGQQRPSVSVAALLDAALGAKGNLSALVHELSADSGGLSAATPIGRDAVSPRLEFARPATRRSRCH